MNNEKQAIDSKILEQKIMDCRIPKNEAEWWAHRRIEELQDFIIWMTGCGYDFKQHECFNNKMEKLVHSSKYQTKYNKNDDNFIIVKNTERTQTLFNFEDGPPFSNDPEWLYDAFDNGRIKWSRNYETDYYTWDIFSKNGEKIGTVEPGDIIQYLPDKKEIKCINIQ